MNGPETRRLRWLLDAEDTLEQARAAEDRGDHELSVALATISAASATLASVPIDLLRYADTRRTIEARGLVERGEGLSVRACCGTPARAPHILQCPVGGRAVVPVLRPVPNDESKGKP